MSARWIGAPALSHLFQEIAVDYGIALQHQGEGDLGERMAEGLPPSRSSATSRAILVGTDCPVRTARRTSSVQEMPSTTGTMWWVGPVEDGGITT